MQMLTVALPSMFANVTQPKRLWIRRSQACGACRTYPRSMIFQAQPAHPLAVLCAQAKCFPANQGMSDTLRRGSHCASCFWGLFSTPCARRYRRVGLLLLVCTHGLRNSVCELPERRAVRSQKLECQICIYEHHSDY